VIEKISPEDQPIIWIAVSGDRSIKELTHYADKVLNGTLKRSRCGFGHDKRRPGPSGAHLAGPRQMEAASLTADDVKAALGREHKEVPAEKIENPARSLW